MSSRAELIQPPAAMQLMGGQYGLVGRREVTGETAVAGRRGDAPALAGFQGERLGERVIDGERLEAGFRQDESVDAAVTE